MKRESLISDSKLLKKGSIDLNTNCDSLNTFNTQYSSSTRAKTQYNLDKIKSRNIHYRKFRHDLTKKTQIFFQNLAKLNYYKVLLYKHIPFLKWFPKYKFKSNLFTDITCGFTIGIMNIPQGMAYALLATLNPIHGLYVSFFPSLIYALFGTSRHVIISAVAIISLLTGEVIDQMTSNFLMTPLNVNGTSVTSNTTDKEIEDNFRLNVAGSLTILIGLNQLLMGFFGLGGLTSFFSDTFISGYTCGSAFHVAVSQIKDVFGLKGVKKFEGLFKVPKSIFELIRKLPESNWITFSLSCACMLFLILFKEIGNPIIKKHIKFEFPSELVLLIAMTSFSYAFDFNQNFNITILKTVPTGLPSPNLTPDLSIIPSLIKDAFLIAVISISISLSLAALFSRRNNYKIDPTQELYALGLTNTVASAFSCFPTAASLSRSSLFESMGGKSQIASIASSLLIMIVILWLAPLFKTLPTLCLATIILVSLKNLLFQVKDFIKLWKVNKYEFVIWTITFLSVVILNVNMGLFIGLGVSILMIIVNDIFSQIKSMVQYRNTTHFVEKNLVVFPEDEDETEISLNNNHIIIANAKVFKIEHSIYYVNCHAFQEHLYKRYGFDKKLLEKRLSESEDSKSDQTNSTKTSDNSSSSNGSNKPSHVLIKLSKEPDLILDLSAVNYVDTNGIKVITQIIDDFKKANIFVYLVECQETFLKIFYHMGLFDKYEQNLYVTIDEAVKDSNEKYAISLK